MARSSFTLAAAVSSADPEAAITAVAELTEHAAGRFDAVCVTLEDGRMLVVRVPAAPDAAEELRAEARALQALSPGMRALLPFEVPALVGQVSVDGELALITSFVRGYRVDPARVPVGPGIATEVGAALAAVHALPVGAIRDAGLIVRSAAQVQDDAARLVDRADSTRRVPLALLARWRRALATEDLWQFEPTAVLDGGSSTSFFFEDTAGMPAVIGVAHWHGLSVGDPAIDLQWLASSPAAASDVLEAYSAAADRAPDALIRARARLHAELEFAKWLVHGHDAGDAAVMTDAEALLSSLADTVAGDDIVPRTTTGVDGAIALLGQVPDTTPTAADTSLHTDAYDPEELAMWLAAPGEDPEPLPDLLDPDVDGDASPRDSVEASDVAAADAASPRSDAEDSAEDYSDVVTAPILLPVAPDTVGDDDADEPARAARAAFQRWTSSDSE